MGRVTKGIGVYIGLRPSNMCEVTFAGARQTPAGVAPEALEESLCSSKGYKCCPTVGSFTGVAVQRLFQPASAPFQPASAFSVLVQRPGIRLNHQAGAR